MREWRHLFRDVILERGNEYYVFDKIVKFVKKDHWYHALVQGETEYVVDVLVRNDKIFDVYCDCPYFIQGELCKHIVAVLLKIEEMEQENSLNE